MTKLNLFDSAGHKNVLLEDATHEGAVQANQHLIVHNGKGMLLDPGGHRAYNQVMADVSSELPLKDLEVLFLSHQDPDIVAAINGWLMTTDATAYASKLWKRFIPHFGMDHLVEHRLLEIPDQGMRLSLNGCELLFLPAHFLHSCGNFQVYDPVSKILYTGDLGASLGNQERVVTDLAGHIPLMESFHQRYMAGNAVMRAWANMVSTLDIECIAPQHGAVMQGKAVVQQFIDWCRHLACGIDLVEGVMRVPQ